MPIALTVLGGGASKAAGAYNVQQITQLAPSLQFGSFNHRNTTVNIRGLGNNVGLANDGLEVGVGFYIDGVYYSRPAAATFDLTDIERIEICAGRRARCSARTPPPAPSTSSPAPRASTTEALAELTVGDLRLHPGQGLDLRSAERHPGRTRPSIRSRPADGLTHNVTTGGDVNDQNSLGLRGAAAVEAQRYLQPAAVRPTTAGRRPTAACWSSPGSPRR